MPNAAPPSSGPNRLIHEKSPYLLQHASNPVDWHPWGEEAFSLARRDDKPVFLSIGYAACHWCHVMERESFSDPAAAAVLNLHYVPVKVDREERPEVDRLYITAVELMTGTAGWPLNVFLTPDLTPFFGGTYFPPERRGGRPSFVQVLEEIAALWRMDRPRVDGAARLLREELSRRGSVLDSGTEPPPHSLGELGFASLRESYDPVNGGFNGAPKFPAPAHHHFLMRYFAGSGSREALRMSVHTLVQMARGGLRDHLGGGFHRYSTDAEWRVPHFEKMLYDNAQLAVAYLEAHRATGYPGLGRIARETLDYLLKDLLLPGGGFASSEDADSEPAGGGAREEGAFYLWRRDEVLKTLGRPAGEMFCRRYGVDGEGDCVLRISRSLSATAREAGSTIVETRNSLERGRAALLDRRSFRARPPRDDKVIGSWNGLAVSAFARAGLAWEDDRYLLAAERAARFVRSALWDEKSHKLLRCWRGEPARVPGGAEDYAFLARGSLDLFEATFDPVWLDWAEDLAESLLNDFEDKDGGGFYSSSSDGGESLFARLKGNVDSVEPSANSVAAAVLARLHRLTGRADFFRSAERTLAAFADQMQDHPISLPFMLGALDLYRSDPARIVVAGERGSPRTREFLRAARWGFVPGRTVLLLSEQGGSREALVRRRPEMALYSAGVGGAAAFVCEGRTCRLRINEPSELAKLVRRMPGAVSPGE